MANQHQHHQHDRDGPNQAQVVVVMVPLPAQGHLNQLLHLSRLISAYHIPVHYVSFATHSRQAKVRLHGWDPKFETNVHFHEFPNPSFLSPSPNPNASTKFPGHLQPAFDVSSFLREPVFTLLHALSPISKRIIVIHDDLMASVVQDVAKIPNAESYTFQSISAFTNFLFYWETVGRPFPIDNEILKDLPSMEGCFTPEFVEFIENQHDFLKHSSGYLFNTSKVIEGPYLKLLSKEEISKNKKLWAIGPFNAISKNDKRHQDPRHECLDWLNKQAPNSVVYVSFGTTTSFTDEQITEIALGLEKSGQKFIWVLRDADKGDVFVGGERRVELPKGFGERVEGRGIVVRDWAPQVEILEHPSTGCFMSHCGWNSCVESITTGVPIVAWPMHSDQPRNAVLITKLLRIGVVLRDWERRDEVVKADMVEEVVRRLIESEEGDEIRKRAKELGSDVRKSVGKGGVSRMELDAFVDHISR